jgi:uncharacterized protein YndB with AHSA1/START domain
MKWVLIVVGALVGLVGIVAIIGSFLPKAHTARRRLLVAQPPERVWAAVTDFPGQAAWRPELKAVERATDRDGKEVWREIPKRGDAMPLETTELVAPRRLVRTIADPSLPFGGRWVYEVEPAPGGARLTITEEGEVYNPIFRFVSHFFMDPAATIDAYLRALCAHLGVPVQMERG